MNHHTQFPYDIETVLKVNQINAKQYSGLKSIPELVKFLLGDCPYCSKAASEVLSQLLPMANLIERWDEKNRSQTIPLKKEPINVSKIPEWIASSTEGWAGERSFLHECLSQLNAVENQNKKEEILERLIQFPGIHRQFAAVLKKTGLMDSAVFFQKKVNEYYDLQFPPQINLAPTMRCQMHCQYCISGSSQIPDDMDMPFENVQKLFQWLIDRNIKRIGLVGGEPSIYQDFKNLLNLIKENSFSTYLATNGIVSENNVESIIAVKPLCVTMHLTPEALHSEMLEVYKRNAKKMIESGVYIILRCNFQNPEEDPEVYLKVASETGIDEVRAAIPTPNSAYMNQYVIFDKLNEYSRLLDTLVSKAAEYKININLAKPFPPCMLKEETAKKLIINGSMSVSCPIHFNDFTNNIIVYPDLKFSPCLSLVKKSESEIIHFQSLADASATFQKDVEALFGKPLMRICYSCPFYESGRCVGACISYRLEGSQSAPKC